MGRRRIGWRVRGGWRVGGFGLLAGLRLGLMGVGICLFLYPFVFLNGECEFVLTDTVAALMAKVYGEETAEKVCNFIEHIRVKEANDDPFAAMNGCEDVQPQ